MNAAFIASTIVLLIKLSTVLRKEKRFKELFIVLCKTKLVRCGGKGLSLLLKLLLINFFFLLLNVVVAVTFVLCSDTCIGMTKQELVDCLEIIAQS